MTTLRSAQERARTIRELFPDGLASHSKKHLDTRLEFLRDITPSLECLCAATLVGGLMVARFAAKVSGDLRAALRNLLQQFGDQLAPGPFRVPKMWSC